MKKNNFLNKTIALLIALALSIIFSSCNINSGAPNIDEGNPLNKWQVVDPPTNQSTTLQWDTIQEAKTQYAQSIIADTIIDDLEEYGGYEVDYVESKYFSQEYIDELLYNSLSNSYFGYDYDEVCSAMGGTNWSFTVDENGQTVVVENSAQNEMVAQLVKKVAIGAGVVVICAVVSAISGGVGAAPVACFFAGAAKGAIVGAINGGLVGGAISGIIKGIQTNDVNQAINSAIEGFGDGFMWGAVAGAITGGFSSSACFSGNTLIQTINGYKKIEDIEPNDFVYSYNEVSKTCEYAPVIKVYSHLTNDQIIITIEDEQIITTASHPFLTARGWIKAGLLHKNDIILSSDNVSYTIQDISLVQKPIWVYNLTVAYNHTYTVSSNNIIVHNACGDSTKLRKAMIDNGELPPTEYRTAAHHIVPSSDGRFPDAAAARKILCQYGVDINSPANGVFLSVDKSVIGTTYHRTLHNAQYYSKVYDILSQATSQESLLSRLAFIKEALLSGTFI